MSHPFWSLLAILALIGWILSTVMLIFKAFPQRDIFLVSSGKRWGVAASLSFVVWVVALLLA